MEAQDSNKPNVTSHRPKWGLQRLIKLLTTNRRNVLNLENNTSAQEGSSAEQSVNNVSIFTPIVTVLPYLAHPRTSRSIFDPESLEVEVNSIDYTTNARYKPLRVESPYYTTRRKASIDKRMIKPKTDKYRYSSKETQKPSRRTTTVGDNQKLWSISPETSFIENEAKFGKVMKGTSSQIYKVKVVEENRKLSNPSPKPICNKGKSNLKDVATKAPSESFHLFQLPPPSKYKSRKRLSNASFIENHPSGEKRKTSAGSSRRGCLNSHLDININYVLVYSEVNEVIYTNQLHRYLSNLKQNGLELKIVHGQSIYSNLSFVQLRLPNATLLRDLQKTKLRSFLTSHGLNESNTLDLIPEDVTSAEKIFIIHQIVAITKYGDQADEYGISEMVKKGILTAAYPLHDGGLENSCANLSSDRQKLRSNWGSMSQILKGQPLQSINEYYGPEVAFYFAWLEYFNLMLIPVAVLGIFTYIYGLSTVEYTNDDRIEYICETRLYLCPFCNNYYVCNFGNLKDSCRYSKLNYLFDNYVTTLFALLMITWAIIFVEYWQKRKMRLQTDWNLHYYTDLDNSLRSDFLHQLKQWNIRAIFKEGEPHMPFVWKASLRFLSMVSIIILILMMCYIVFGMGLLRIQLTRDLSETYVTNEYAESSYPLKVIVRSEGSILSSIIVSLISGFLIIIFSKVYSAIAAWLTAVESPRTQKEYINSYITKLFILECFNNYSLPFYIAFIKGAYHTYPGDRYNWLEHRGINADLCDPSGCILDLSIYIGIVLTIKMVHSWPYSMFFIFWNSRRPTTPMDAQWELDYNLKQIKWQLYIAELYIQPVIKYGFSIFFVAAFPLAPLIVLIDNVITIRINAIIACRILRRPVLRRVVDLEIWDAIILIMTVFAIVVNAYVIAFTSDIVQRITFSVDGGDSANYVASTITDFYLGAYEGVNWYDSIHRYWEIRCHYKGYRSNHNYRLTKTHYRMVLHKYVFVNVVVFFAIVFALMFHMLTWSYDKQRPYEDTTDVLQE